MIKNDEYLPFQGRIAQGNAEFPEGSFVDAEEPGTGSPIIAAKMNEYEAFFQSLLINGEVVPSGVPDTVANCQTIQAMENWVVDLATNNATGVTSLNGNVGDLTLTAASLNLGNVDNTADADKEISNPTQVALDGKAPVVHNHVAATDTLFGFMSPTQVTKLNGISANAQVNAFGFQSVLVPGQSAITAQTDADTINIEGTNGISVTTNPANNKITFSSSFPIASQSLDGLMPSSLVAKLASIETNATADMTGAQIKTAYESQGNTNAFTDAEKSKLANIQANATAGGVSSINGASGAVSLNADSISDASTNHKFVTAAQVAKINSVEDGATRDQNGSEIKALYEGQPNTNVFTDAEKSKLQGLNPNSGGAVSSVNGQTGTVVLDKSNIGLDLVDNTPDADKQVSNPTLAALNGKQNTITGSARSIVTSNLPGGNAVITNGSGEIDVSPVTAADLLAIQGSAGANFQALFADLYGNRVTRVNNQSGTVTLDADDIPPTNFRRYFEAADATKLFSIEPGAEVNTVTSVNNKQGAVVVTKGDVSLGNVDNTSDANKPISNPTQAALNGKQDTITGAISTAVTNNFTPERVLVTAVNGKMVTSSITDGELNTLTGVTSNIQSQLNDLANNGGTGAVDSVNGQTGIIVLHSDNIDDTGRAHRFITSADKAKLDGIATSADVNQDAFKTIVADNVSVTAVTPTDTVTFKEGTGVLIDGNNTTKEVSFALNYFSIRDQVPAANLTHRGMMTAADKAKLDGLPATADANQNAFSIISVGGTNVNAVSVTDTVTYTSSDGMVLTGNNSTKGINFGIDVATLRNTIPGASTTTRGMMIATDKIKLNSVATGAQVNQNAFSNMAVGNTIASADSPTDTFSFNSGSGISLSMNSSTDSLQISVNYSNIADNTPVATSSDKGLMSTLDKSKLDNLSVKRLDHNSGNSTMTLSAAHSGEIIEKTVTGSRSYHLVASVAVGTAITLVNNASSGDMVLNPSGTTLRVAGDGSTGARDIKPYGMATVVKVNATTWFVSGAGLE